MHTTRHVLAIGLAAVLLGGCGGDDDAPAQPSAAPATKAATKAATNSVRPIAERVALDPQAPKAADATLDTDGPYVGKWSARVSGDDLAAAAADTRFEGEMRLELRADGTYTTYQPLDRESHGRYKAAPGDVLVFTKDKGCEEGSRSGTSVYKWALDGGKLTLTLIREESGGCTGRSDTLVTPRWSPG